MLFCKTSVSQKQNSQTSERDKEMVKTILQLQDKKKHENKALAMHIYMKTLLMKPWTKANFSN